MAAWVRQEFAAFARAGLQAERAMHMANTERELALERVHRAENALHMAAHLLAQQAGETVNAVARRAIEAARGRILAVGNMHRLIDEEVATDLGPVIHAVSNVLLRGHEQFSFTVKQDQPLVVASSQAALVVLIVNELIKNAIKHAPERPVAIHAELRQLVDAVEVTIADDGDPYPDEDAPSGRGRHGMNLAGALARQLGGALAIDKARKRSTLTFPRGLPGSC